MILDQISVKSVILEEIKKVAPKACTLFFFLNSGTGTELYSEIVTRLRTLFNTGLDRLKMYNFWSGENSLPRECTFVQILAMGQNYFSNVTCDNVFEKLMAFSYDYYWNKR
jgi:hypothetical protein